MMTCEQIQADAAGWAAMDVDDAERKAIVAHATTCAACHAALTEGALLLAMLDDVPSLTAPSPEVLRRVSADILGQKPKRPAWRPVVGIAASVLAAWLLPMAGGRRLSGSAPAVLGALALALLGALVAGAALAFGGPVLAAIPIVSLADSLLRGADAGLQATVGAKCALFELGLGLIPAAAATWLARKGSVDRPAIAVGAATGGGALAAQGVLHMTCHAAPSVSHAIVFHTMPVALAIGIGYLLGARLSRISR